jgi:hypothetical protein
MITKYKWPLIILGVVLAFVFLPKIFSSSSGCI